MLSLLKDLNDAELLEKFVRARFGDIKIVEVNPSDAVCNGPYMMLLGDTEDWAQIIGTDSGDLSLSDWMGKFGRKERFWDVLIWYMVKIPLSDTALYNKAGISRSVFSDLRGGKNPAWDTAIKICLALELDLKQTADLLRLAGYTLSRSKKEDLIIMYSILHKDFSLISINEQLFNAGCKLIR